ncbi:sigma factor-like helix-turn-helix DNA-binding protein [Azospirillum aestuarii]|uniref:sigma factor-like helix-turn-helix DNA-binding protein n=1 Tax=Azospirillum aestuarii TaxID=2802052 RepID=UPI004054A87C
MTTLKEFEEALKTAGNTEALEILGKLRERDKAQRSIRPARRVVGKKMTPELAAQILELHRTTDMTQQEIAFQLGVNQGRVNEVIKRGKWLNDDPNAPEAVARDKAKARAKDGVGIDPRPTRPKKKKAAKPDEEPAVEAVQEAVAEAVPPVEAPAVEEPAHPPEPVAVTPSAPVPEPAPLERVEMALNPDAQDTAAEDTAAQDQSAEDKPAAEKSPKEKKKKRKAGPPAQLLFDGL